MTFTSLKIYVDRFVAASGRSRLPISTIPTYLSFIMNSPPFPISAEDASVDTTLDLLLDSSSLNLEFKSFWSFYALCKVLTRDRILQALQGSRDIFASADELESYANRIRPVYTEVKDILDSSILFKPSSKPESYLKILAILLLIDKVPSIKQFIDEGISDSDLPLELPKITPRNWNQVHSRKTGVDKGLHEFFRHWRRTELYHFNQYQFEVTVPFFEYQPGNAVHYNLPPRTVLPWLALGDMTDDAGVPRPLSGSLHVGGFGSIRQVRIDPSSHSFHELSSTVSIFNIHFIARSTCFLYHASPQSESHKNRATHGNHGTRTLAW